MAFGISLQRFRVTHKCVPLAFLPISHFLCFQGLILQLAQANRLTSEPQTHRPHSHCLIRWLLFQNTKIPFWIVPTGLTEFLYLKSNSLCHQYIDVLINKHYVKSIADPDYLILNKFLEHYLFNISNKSYICLVFELQYLILK